jgi:hypothetical protein
MSVEELADRVVREGLAGLDDVDAVDEAVEELISDSDDYWLASPGDDGDGEVVVLVSTLVDTGMTFTHRVTAAEVHSGDLELAPDLSVVLWNVRRGLPLDDGSGLVVEEFPGRGVSLLTGPVGWLEAVRPGELLAFRRTDGALSVEVVAESEVGDGAREVEALRDAAARWIGAGRGEEEVPVVMEAMALDPTLFRTPVPPVGELLVAAGLERRGHEWGWAGEEWRTRREQFAAGESGVRRLYGFDACCERAYQRVEAAFEAHGSAGEVDFRTLAGDLGHGAVAAAFVASNEHRLGDVAAFAAGAASATSGRHLAPGLALLGLARLAGGDAPGALEVLRSAVLADPGLPVAANQLAVLELDRGDLSRAHTLAVQAGVDADLIDLIDDERARQAALRPSAGRNDPCPCGSGKKFKRCCAVGGPLPLAQRVPLVLRRISYFTDGPECHDVTFGLGISAAGGHDDLAAAITRFSHDMFLADVAIHEGGLGETYLAQRGALLAGDEAELAGRLLGEPLRLWEITSVVERESLIVRDTATGEEITVSEHRGSEGREPGELLLCRSATVGDEPILFGVPLLVPLRHRARVLEMLDGWVDADSIAMWYGSLFLAPHVTNREGEQIVGRRTVLELADDPGGIVAALDGAYERVEGLGDVEGPGSGEGPGDGEEEAVVWHDIVVLDGAERVIRATLRLDGTRLTVESNSEQRQERVLDTLEDLLDFEIVDDEVLDALQLAADDLADGDGGGGNGGIPGPLGPGDVPDEVREALEQHIAETEQRWVDESIPALGGLTPRQALDDPTRREDLMALLREMRAMQLPEGAVGCRRSGSRGSSGSAAGRASGRGRSATGLFGPGAAPDLALLCPAALKRTWVRPARTAASAGMQQPSTARTAVADSAG